MPILRDRVVSEKFEIDAPIEEVWKLLTDFDGYPAWNPFTEEVSTSMVPGTPVVMKVNLFPPKSMRQVEVFESHKDQRELVWGLLKRPWLMRAKRTQRIEPIGENRCTYQTWDEFAGITRWLVLKLTGPAMERGFNSVGAALQRHFKQSEQKVS